jgi:hypothetical protein
MNTSLEVDDVVIQRIHAFIHQHRLCLYNIRTIDKVFSILLSFLILFETAVKLEQRGGVNFSIV